MRWFNAILFLAAAVWVRHYDLTHTDSQLVLPFLPGTDKLEQGRMTWHILGWVGLGFAVWALYHSVVEWRTRAESKRTG